ncbi:MAG TPA: CocE/NonD family hydrolase [Actinomycetota bacterium]|nr:CocE/NonD family hydrolase [Actinomycetota bacterium]
MSPTRRCHAHLVLLALVASVLLPSPAAAAVPEPPYEHTYERVLVSMRDGVELSADIWRPVVPEGQKVPVILTLTPYRALYRANDRQESTLPSITGSVARRYVPKGYAFVLADVRGTYNSGGCWSYGGKSEREDGYDLVEWFGTRDWSNGRVGMIGGSYDGTTANAAAVEQPPHLSTIVPISAISRWWGYAYHGGARVTYSGETADADPPSDTPTDFMFAYGFIPPPSPSAADDPARIAARWNPCDRVRQTLKGYSTQPDYDEFWQERDYLRHAPDIKVPALVAHGLLDSNVKSWEGTAWYQALGGPKRLVVGGWGHSVPLVTGWNQLLDRWFARWLMDVPNGVEDEPGVWVQQGTQGPRVQSSWGTGSVLRVPLAGDAFTYTDDGALTESEMIRGLGAGLRFTSVPVEVPAGVEVEGRPVLRLRARTNATSTHFVATLRAGQRVVGRGFLNARYADSLEQGQDLVPGVERSFPIELIDNDFRLQAGEKLELLLASSSTTWVAPDEQRSTNTLLLDGSFLELPLRGQ